MSTAYNCIIVFNSKRDAALFCKRQKKPYKGLLNFPGGKVESGESPYQAAYRELEEETGITRGQICLHRLMDIRYYHQGFTLELFVGMLQEEVVLKEELNPLLWLPVDEDFTDGTRFAGDQNIAHIMNVARKYPLTLLELTKSGLYIGVDGYKGGWVAAVIDKGNLRIETATTVQMITDKYPSFDAFLIDMAIGLPDRPEQKRPDKYARKELGKRASSVFPIPCRQAVYLEDREAQIQTNIKVLKKSLSRQSLGIIPKIKELDEFMFEHPEYKDVILESHPELAFARLNAAGLIHSKKEKAGIRERINILSEYVDRNELERVQKKAKELGCSPDDILDAICLAVTSILKAHDMCETIPEVPDVDDRGLRMQLTVPIKM